MIMQATIPHTIKTNVLFPWLQTPMKFLIMQLQLQKNSWHFCPRILIYLRHVSLELDDRLMNKEKLHLKQWDKPH